MGASVSVIIPTYNRADLLLWAASSVLAQSHCDLEALIIDDGSTDGTPALLDNLVAADSRVRLLRQDHKGAQAARNLGIAQAKGDFIAFLDDDDLWHPKKIERQIVAFDTDRELDGVICQTVWFREWPGDHNRLFNVFSGGDPLERFLGLDVVFQTAAPLWRRGLIERVGPWDERLTSGQDLDFHTRCLCLKPKLLFQPETLNFFREHPGTRITRARKEEHASNTLIAMQNAASALRGSLTPGQGEALASTVMRQSRFLAFQGEERLADDALRLALETHPSKRTHAAIRKFLWPLNRASKRTCGGTLAKVLRRIAHHGMYAMGVERPRVSWWQQYPFEDDRAIAAWSNELEPVREIAKGIDRAASAPKG